MKTFSAAAILISSVLLWQCSVCYGHTPCQSVCQWLGLSYTNPATSCRAIYECNPKATSGYYWLITGSPPAVSLSRQYCDMETSHCGIQGGWMRVAYWNMADSQTRCPTRLRYTNPGKRLCTKSTSSGCTSLLYSTHGMSYSRICGRIKGYAYYSPDAFGAIATGPKNIDSAYTDGVSITYGSSRKHVWTYAAGLQEEANYRGLSCPCGKVPGDLPPSFVGDNYYCESANQGPWEPRWYLHDPLWDGHGCPHGNNCCANAGLPWFCRTLPAASKEDIEVRLCCNQDRRDEDIGVELLELLIY